MLTSMMRRIDELHLALPLAGVRMLRDLLRTEGFVVGRKHMTTLMRRMGITALYRKPNTSRRAPGSDNPPVPAAHAGNHALEPRLGDEHQPQPDGARQEQILSNLLWAGGGINRGEHGAQRDECTRGVDLRSHGAGPVS